MTDIPNPHGQRILAESFAIIERELGPHTFPPWAFAVVRRMIHASADFEFAQLLQSSADFPTAFAAAVEACSAVVTDTEMVRLGIATAAERAHLPLACYLNDPAVPVLTFDHGLTRSAAGIRVAARHHPAPLVVIGNAPTALDEALRLAADGCWRPRGV